PAPQTYTHSLHDALPISNADEIRGAIDRDKRSDLREWNSHYADRRNRPEIRRVTRRHEIWKARNNHYPKSVPNHERDANQYRSQDRKSTRLNSSHRTISY